MSVYFGPPDGPGLSHLSEYARLLERTATALPLVVVVNILRPLPAIEVARLACVHETFYQALLVLRNEDARFAKPSDEELDNAWYKHYSRLRYASTFGDFAVVRSLLSGSETFAPKDLTESLEAAAEKGYYDIVQILVEHGAQDKTNTSWYWCALLNASVGGFLNIVQLLKQSFDYNENQLRHALEYGSSEGHEDVVRFLLDNGVGIQNATRALFDASKNGKTAIVQLLLDRGVDVLGASSYGDESLIKASENGHLEVVRLLIQRGVNARAENSKALNVASLGNHLEISQLLLQRGADPNVRDGILFTSACTRGNLNMVQLLHQYGANIHARDDEGFLDACSHGHIDVVTFLLQNGCDVHIQNDLGLIEAAAYGQVNMVQFLLQRGANVHARNDLALISAAWGGYADVVRLLLQHGADVHAQNDLSLRKAMREEQKYMSNHDERVAAYSAVIAVLREYGAQITQPPPPSAA
jgi:ankyrin repeat protein